MVCNVLQIISQWLWLSILDFLNVFKGSMQSADKSRTWAKAAVRRIVQWSYCLCQLYRRDKVRQYRSASRCEVGWSRMGFSGNHDFFLWMKYDVISCFSKNFRNSFNFHCISHFWRCFSDVFLFRAIRRI